VCNDNNANENSGVMSKKEEIGDKKSHDSNENFVSMQNPTASGNKVQEKYFLKA